MKFGIKKCWSPLNFKCYFNIFSVSLKTEVTYILGVKKMELSYLYIKPKLEMHFR